MTGRKTHEQQIRTLERKPDVPGRGSIGTQGASHKTPHQDVRPTEFPISTTGFNQESRDHNKHNRSGQEGHKPQKHGPDEEKS